MNVRKYRIVHLARSVHRAHGTRYTHTVPQTIKAATLTPDDIAAKLVPTGTHLPHKTHKVPVLSRASSVDGGVSNELGVNLHRSVETNGAFLCIRTARTAAAAQVEAATMNNHVSSAKSEWAHNRTSIL